MTQEEKELLLKDLCARFHYNVKVLEDIDKEFDGGCIAELVTITEIKGEKMFLIKNSLTPVTIEEIRPYLRSMDSITPYEQKEYNNILKRMTNTNDADILYCYSTILQNFFLSHHIDNKGLIEKGLALEATEGMYK